jgi:hypothetical protein
MQLVCRNILLDIDFMHVNTRIAMSEIPINIMVFFSQCIIIMDIPYSEVLTNQFYNVFL